MEESKGGNNKAKVNSDKNAFSDVVGFLLEEITPRAKEVLMLRFGLDGNKPQSLNIIGKKFGITRERVRQIEVDSFKKMKKSEKSDEHNKIIDQAIEIIFSYGGFCEKRKLKEEIKPDITELERKLLMIILNSSKRIKFQKANKQLDAYWFVDGGVSQRIIAEYSKKIGDFIVSRKAPIQFSDILEFACELDGDFFQNQSGERKLRMILSLNRNLQCNILEEWGLKKWNLISGKGSRERAYLVLRKFNEPMHFRSLAEKINDNFKDKLTLSQTVHNELIKDGRFVQVGKGTYGLAEWGLVQGTVKDVIMKLLKEKKQALRDEIIDYVMAQKKVKKTTIIVNLANQEVFSRDGEGNYFLA